MCIHQITITYIHKLQPLYYISFLTSFKLAKKLCCCYGGNGKPIAVMQTKKCGQWLKVFNLWAELVDPRDIC